MRLLGWLLFLAVLGSFQPVSAQLPFSPPDSLGLLQTQVRRIGIATYTGQSGVAFAGRSDSQQVVLRYSHNWIYNSSGSISGFVRNDQQLLLSHSSQLGRSGFRAGQQLNFSEYQANRTSILKLLQQAEYRYTSDSAFTLHGRVFGGIRRDERFGHPDFGPEGGAAFQAALAEQASVGAAAGGVFFNRAQVGPRRFQRLQADALYSSPQGLPAGAELSLGYYSVYSADYLSGNVQSIRSDTLFANLMANYKINEQLAFRSVSRGSLPARQFRYFRQPGGAPEQQHFGYNQVQLETENRLQYTVNRLSASVEFIYRERSRTYGLRNNRNLSPIELKQAEDRERIKDLKEAYTIWIWNVHWQLSKRHSLSAQTTAHLLRLDTPSQANNQDRDEVYYLGRFTWQTRWHPNLRTHFSVSADDRQYVFIKAEQSIENYRERVLRWEPGFTWVQGRFSWTGAVQLWATYHVREARTEQLRNRATRTYQQVHELALELPRRFRLQANYTRRENRTGLLNWETFSESPLDTIVSHDFALALEKRYARDNNFTALRLGYRLFHQGQHRKAGLESPNGVRTIYLRDITRQHGPELYVHRSVAAYLDVTASLWLQFVNTFSRYKTTDLPYAGSVVSQQQLNQELRALYPYFSISLSWYFGRHLPRVF